MKKRITAILVCGVIAVGMVGCNSSSDTSEQADETQEQAEESEEQAEESEEQADEAAEQADEAEDETVSDAQPDESATELLDQYIAEGNELSSKKEYIDMLTGEGYSEDVAKATVDAYDYDWDGLALKDLGSLYEAQAEDGTGCTPSDCSDWLKEDGFTSDEIDYALANCDIDWNKEAAAKANAYMEFDSDRDPEDVLKSLEMNGFSEEQAEYGVDNINAAGEE